METKLKIINGLVFQDEKYFRQTPVYICGERIVSEETYLSSSGDETVIDAAGKYVIPGLMDIHFHGCMGSDCCDGTAEAFETIAKYELKQGVTSITPATMTVSEETLSQICKTTKDFTCPDGADFCGLYMEGPFISPAKKGAQNQMFIHPADTELFNRLQELSGGRIRTVVVAPETDGAMEFIRRNKDNVNISIGHTNADYDISKKAFSCGASQLTHMYNAMPLFNHRAPGPIGAAAEDPHCMVELICDGIHIHPSVIRAAFHMFGEERIIFISDSMRATGMKDGTYDLGGQAVSVNGHLAVLKDGTLAGSVTNLMDCVRTAVNDMDIPLANAVKCASTNPARAIGMEHDYGCLKPEAYANIVILNQDLTLDTVLHRGKVSS